MNVVSINEARKGLIRAALIELLTTLAFIFVSMSFVTFFWHEYHSLWRSWGSFGTIFSSGYTHQSDMLVGPVVALGQATDEVSPFLVAIWPDLTKVT